MRGGNACTDIATSQVHEFGASEVIDFHSDLTSPLPVEFTESAPAAAWLPAPPTAEQSADSAGVTAAPVGPGTVLRQRYVLERELGRGGMGTVFRALDRNRQGLPAQSQYVAVKVLREEFARRPDALAALRLEAHQAQSLSHPGIVNVFDFDRDGDVYFVTMELLEGELLSDLMRRTRPGAPSRPAAIGILRELGSAVAYAHARGVLHMDLKPGNVMITTDGNVRVLDFGLARPHVKEPWISDHPTPFHAATATYASCEQLEGAAPDVRDDVFSFACVAYELLSGEHPFGRRSSREARDRGHRPRRVRGLSRRQWRTLRRGLAWTRDDRPQDLDELLEGLELATAPQTPASSHRSGRARMRSGSPLSWLAVAGLGILGAGAYFALDGSAPWAVFDRFLAGHDPGVTQPAQRDEQSQAAATAPDSAATEAPVADSIATIEDFVPLNVAATLARIPAPRARIAPADPGRIGFESNTVLVSESDKVVRLRVVRRGGTDGAVSFVWRAIDDSAIGGQDYGLLGTAEQTMGPGQASTTLLVPIASDQVKESTELFDVAIDEPGGGASLDAIPRVTVIVVDDD